MIIYPVIELQNGRCTSALKSPLKHNGQASANHDVHDAVQIAAHWEEQGAEWLHLVNLDGKLQVSQFQIDALYGSPYIKIQMPGEKKPQDRRMAMLQGLAPNLRCLHKICKAVNVPVQFSGGIYTLADIEMALSLGAKRVVLDVVAVQNVELVRKAVEQWGSERIAAGIDAYRNYVWLNHGNGLPRDAKKDGVSAIEVGHYIHALGIQRLVYNEKKPDGTPGALHMDETSRLGDTTDLQVIVNGQLRRLQAVEHLKDFEHYNVEGVILGEPLYENEIELSRAIAIGHRGLSRRSAGIVPFRQGDSGPEFLMLFNLFFEQWQFPRGGVENGEGDLVCAQREFAEETGMTLAHLHQTCRTELNYTDLIRDHEIDRTVVYFLAEVEPGDVRLGHENHCEARWLSPESAWELLTETAPEQIPALDAAVAYLQGHTK